VFVHGKNLLGLCKLDLGNDPMMII
jgi:hypothetical protein